MILSDYSVILKTKMMIPAPKDQLVERDRLMKTLDQGARRRLTVISAPAGFGKSTLLTQWIYSRGILCAWVSLDGMDNDPVRFWRYAVHSLARVVPDPSAKRLVALASGFTSMSVHTFLDALMNELYELPAPVTWIWDDYQWITNPQIHDQVAYLIDYLPEHIHMMISTRTELPFSTIKWMTKQESTHIHTQDMQFTEDETQNYYREVSDTELTDHQIGQLVHRIEGWVTGLQLMSLSLRSDGHFGKLIEEFKGSRHDVAEYLFQEVLSNLPADVREFLLATSVLSRLNPEICDEVTGIVHSLDKLEMLKTLNLFLIPLDHEHQTFRYHHLFAQFLQGLLRRTDPAAWTTLHLKAAHSLADRGYMDEAIDHAILAEEFTLLETYLTRHIPIVLERGELGTLLRWFNSIPAAHELSLELSLFYTFVLAMTGQLEFAENKLEEIEHSLGQVQETAQREQLQSGILFVRSNLVFMNRDFAKWFAFIEGILEDIVPENPTYYNFNYNLTEPFVRRTPMGLNGVLSADTEKMGQMFTGVLEAHGWQNSLINLYVKQSLCEGYYEWNKLAECRKLMPSIEQAAVAKKVWGLIVPVLLIDAKLYMMEGRFHMAHHIVDEAVSMAASQPSAPWLSLLTAFRVRMYLREDRLAEARKEMAKLDLSSKDKPTFNREFHYVTLARLLGRQRKESEALRLLELLKPQAIREQQLASRVEITVLQALMEYQRGQRSASMDLIHEALAIGEQNGYMRSFADEGAPMAELLSAYKATRNGASQELTWQGVSDTYIRSLLQLFPKTTKPYTVRPQQQVEPLNRSELQILRLLQQGATNKHIAAELKLTEGTIRVYLSRMYEKLHVSTRTQALIAAQEMELTE